MKLYVNMPTTEDGKKMLNEAMAQVQATLVLKAIDDLNLSSESKKKVLQGILDELDRQIKKDKSVNW